jgi:hypothetical protein
MSQSGKPAAFVVIPEFVVKPDRIDAFLALAQDDASHSVTDEPGCRQFDVVQMEGAPHRSSSMRCMTAGRRSTPTCKRRIWPGFGRAFPRWCWRSAPSASQAVIMDNHHG